MKNHCAFWQGFEKRAATRSEILGTTASSLIFAPLNFVSSLVGVAKGPYTQNEQREVNKKSFSNLIPIVGPYRLGRRTAGVGLDKDKRTEK